MNKIDILKTFEPDYPITEPPTSHANFPIGYYEYIDDSNSIHPEMGEFSFTDNLGTFNMPTLLVQFKDQKGSWTKEYRCLIDTGTFFTMISPALAKDLGLPLLEKTQDSDHVEYGIQPHLQMEVSLKIEGVEFNETCLVLRKEQTFYAALLGTKFLRECELHYNGPANKYSLSFKKLSHYRSEVILKSPEGLH